MPYIYKITNNINGKIYIGKTNFTIEKRWKEHCSDYKRETFQKRPLYLAMKKYGIENFSIEEIEQIETPELAVEREKYWIEYFGSFKNGYNVTIGGDGKTYIDYDLVVTTYRQLKNQNLVAEKLKISVKSVRNILRIKEEKIYSKKEVAQANTGKCVDMFDLSNNYLRSFASIWSAAKFMVENKLTNCKTSTIKQHISEVCKGKRKTASKYIWRFSNNNI